MQKLVELIPAATTRPGARGDSPRRSRKTLRKTVVPAHDIAGFIGNGHFMRDGLHGIAEVERLRPRCRSSRRSTRSTGSRQDWLVRPMGIFQLIDYVGVDVFQCILPVMGRTSRPSCSTAR